MDRKVVIFLLVPLVFILTATLVGNLLGSYNDNYREGEIIAEVREKILFHYVDEVPRDKLLKGALHGMTSSLDYYSEYLDEDDFKQMFESTEGEFVGIGIVIGLEEGVLTVISPMDDSPASKAGILAGDKVLAINGESTEGISLNEAMLKLRGEKDSKVVLSVLHEGSKVTEEITILRDVIHIQSIKDAKILEPGIGYLRMIRFNKHTGEELAKSIEKLRKDGMHSLIIDLRFNPGGLLDASVAVVNQFISDGVIVYTKGRTKESFMVYRASKQNSCETVNLAILVNKRSASASEIVAAALQDYHRAIVVGTRTYGKGSVQSIMRLRDEKTAIKLTTARYYSPAGRSINKTKTEEGGVVPDVPVPLTVEEEQALMQWFYNYAKNKKETDEFVDKQLQKAISILKEQKISYKFR